LYVTYLFLSIVCFDAAHIILPLRLVVPLLYADGDVLEVEWHGLGVSDLFF
jgi:hypothetical protein